MELNFSWKRVALFFALLGAFWVMGGFDCPKAAPGALPDSHALAKAWRNSVMLFLFGAAAVSLVDHFVGTMDRSNVRLLYILCGSLVMIVSLLWIRALRTTASGGGAQKRQALWRSSGADSGSVAGIEAWRQTG